MDTQVLMFFQTLRNHSAFLLPFFTLLYRLQGYWLLTAALILYWSYDKTAGRKLIRLYSITMLAAHTLNIISCRPRPWLRNEQILVNEAVKKTAGGFSMPEMTTARTGSLTFGTAAAIGSRKLILAAMLLTVLSAFSGLFIGASGFLDVLSALEIDALVLLTFMLLPSSIASSPRWIRWFRFIGIAVCTVLVLYATVKAYPHIYDGDQLAVDPVLITKNFCSSAGLLVGTITGMYIENNLIDYEVPGDNRIRVLTTVFGTVFTGILYYLLIYVSRYLLPESWGGFWSVMLVMVFACAGVPALTQKFLRKE